MSSKTADRFIFSAVVAVLFALMPASVVFAAVDYGAEIVDVQGLAQVTVKSNKETVDAFVGQRLSVGDSIETGRDGAAEIMFDDGNVTRLDENSRITIELLSIEADSSRKSVLGLAFGRVKNLVSKLEHKRSRFEIHTKSAVVGVRGTPQWAVGAFDGEKHKTEADLLGGEGEKGTIFVRGRDTAKTVVILKPRMRTIVTMGLPPLDPFAISPDRFRRLQLIMPVKTAPKQREEKRKEILKKTEKPGKDAAIMEDHLTRVVSVAEIENPADSETGEESEGQVSGKVEGSGEAAVPGTTAGITVQVTIVEP